MRMKIVISPEFKAVWPAFRGKAVSATVKNTPYNEELWKEIEQLTEEYRATYTPDTVKEIVPIKATRDEWGRLENHTKVSDAAC